MGVCWIGFSLRFWRSQIRGVEDFCFDSRRNISTSGTSALGELTIRGDSSDCFMYMPVRAINAYRALNALPVRDHSQYTFVDLGSGKGRMMFIAAEYPFRSIRGIEFASELHEIALQNIRHYRSNQVRCRDIASLHINAMEYDFPKHNLVVCMFNPFGPKVLREVLRNLESSIREYPRHVILVLIHPEAAAVLKGSNTFKVYVRTRRFHIYQGDPE